MLVSLLLACLQGAPERPPNVVLIVADDLGWTDLGCQGSDLYETPNLDRLSSMGVRFTRAYSDSPVCSPARVALMTGRSPIRTGITDWIPGVRYPHAPLDTPALPDELPLDEVTLAELFKAAGYRTFHVGKWHLGGEGFGPLEQGFDVNIGGHSKGAPGSYFHPYAKVTPATDWSVRNLPAGGAEGDYLTDRLTAEACKLIEETDEPFFLHLSYYAVHTPLEGKPELVEHYRTKKAEPREEALRHKNAVYAAMVHCMDQNVGRLLAQLEESGIADETIIVFTSDNGGVEGVTDNAPLRHFKGTLYEGGIRVPLFLAWPGVAPVGDVVSNPVTGVDVFATLAAVAGGSEAELDGLDLRRLFDESERYFEDFWERSLVWHYPHYHTPARPPSSAISDGDYKLIRFYEGNRHELYDLSDDPGEANDLSSVHPDYVESMSAELDKRLAELGARIPEANGKHDPEAPFGGGFTNW